jgi:hypothetical protein
MKCPEFDHDVDVVLNELHVVTGIDSNGAAVYAVKWLATDTYDPETNSNALPHLVTGLGMCEAAKLDLLQRIGLVANE